MVEFADEASLVRALQARDEAAFAFLVDRDHRWLFRLARQYVSSDAVALEVVQDTWLAVIEGIDRFEGRSTLRTWLARIVMNQARTRGVREARTVPFASAGDPASPDGPGGFDLDRFAARGSARGHWTDPPDDWSTIPADRLEAAEVRAVTREAIDHLPDQQRVVISLRDVEGWSAAEVCEVAGLTEVNQRVLLHRARSSVRRALEAYLESAR